MSTENPNTRWARAFVTALAECGLRAVSLAPGARSTPLALAFAAEGRIRAYVHGDERSAAFFALGLALAGRSPAAVLCTSGTAAANLHPAAVEACYAGVPLLLLTADRPHDQRDSGANQTIDQVKLFANHALWSVDVPPPEADPPARALRHLRALAARSLFVADGLRKGPVHLNFPFRKPLHAEALEAGSLEASPPAPAAVLERGALVPTEAQLDALAGDLRRRPRGLIVCGPRCPGGGFPQAVAALARAAGYPLLADPLSGVRHGPHAAQGGVCGAYEWFLQRPPGARPDVVLRFGAMPTSKALGQYLASLDGARQVAVSESGLWPDPTHRLDRLLWAEPERVCDGVRQRLRAGAGRPDGGWLADWTAREAASRAAVEAHLKRHFTEESATHELVARLPAGGALFVSNSLPVRHLEVVGPGGKSLRVLANRGASGIDGTVSSALGAAAALDGPLVLLTGDLSFYHDLNGLLAIKRYGIPLTIVLLNNDGGGIFHRLPVARVEPPFSEMFLTPHGLDFSHAARLYGLDYESIPTGDGARAAFSAALDVALEAARTAPRGARLLDVRFDGRQNHRRYEALAVAAAAAGADPQGGSG